MYFFWYIYLLRFLHVTLYICSYICIVYNIISSLANMHVADGFNSLISTTTQGWNIKVETLYIHCTWYNVKVIIPFSLFDLPLVIDVSISLFSKNLFYIYRQVLRICTACSIDVRKKECSWKRNEQNLENLMKG